MLVAVLFGPFFIDWNGFRSTFEKRASEVFGQPVRISGDIDLAMLPSPTVTIDGLEIGDIEGAPMATIDHVSLKLELLPLLTGQFHVTELIVDRPVVNAIIDDTGRLDWLVRPTGAAALDPDRVVLDQIFVTNGSLGLFDARTGAQLLFTQINTNLFEAVSLEGPWRVDGSLTCQDQTICGDGLPVTFSLATGRAAVDGSLRVTTEITPASAALAGTLRTEGTLVAGDTNLAYEGSFNFAKLDLSNQAVLDDSPEGLLGAAWTIGGGFRLEAGFLALNEISWESGDGFLALTGDATLTLGDEVTFDTSLVSRQIDLDRLYGGDDVTSAGNAIGELWLQLGGLTLPSIPGRFTLSIPSVIVSGSVLQDMHLEAHTGAGRWEVDALQLQLPGQTDVLLGGQLVAGETPSFNGIFSVNAGLPAVLADWLGTGGGTIDLAPFSLAGEIEATPDDFLLRESVFRVGDDSLNGSVRWLGDIAGPLLDADVTTQSFELDQLRALADLFAAGRAERGTQYELRFEAAEIVVGDAIMGDVVIDVALSDDEFVIDEFEIGNLDGAEIVLAGGLRGLSEDRTRGTLSAAVDAADLTGIVALAQDLFGDVELVRWLEQSAPFLAPLTLETIITTEAAAGYTYQLTFNGIAGATIFRGEIDTNGDLDGWDLADTAIEIAIDAADGSELARQVGLPDPAIEDAGPATIDFNANGVPGAGMAAHLQANIAGVVVATDGVLTLGEAIETAFIGPITVNGDVDPLAALLGVTMPNTGDPKPAVLQGEIDLAGRSVAVQIGPSSILQRSIEGALVLENNEQGWSARGELLLDEVDLAWLANLQIGVDVLPDGDPDAPWSRAPFLGPLWPSVAVDLDIVAGRLVVGDRLTVTNADLGFSFGPENARLELRNGSLFAGLVRSTLSFALQDGQVDLDGQLLLVDVPVDAMVWRNDGQPVADGIISFSSEFSSSGRSMAGLVSGLTGSGALGIDQGEFHFLGADAFDLIIRLADEGEAFTEEALRSAFIGFLDAGTLEFGTEEIAFDIAAGVVTPRPIIQDVGPVRVVARAPIDLARLWLDSSWELTLVEGRGIEDGLRPSVFVTFVGPLASPARQVNVAPLAGYLSLRRLQENERLEAEILERERFIRVIEQFEAEPDAVPFEPAPAPPLELPVTPLPNIPAGP